MRQESIEAFMMLVRAGLWPNDNHNENHVLFEDVDWAEVYQLSKEQKVDGLVADGIEILQNEWLKTHESPLVPEKWTMKLAGATLTLEKNNAEMNAFIATMATHLGERDIKTLLLKGQVAAMCYENPLRRTCGDVDLLLSQEDFQKAKDYLLPRASYSVERKQLKLLLGKWFVELHKSLHCGFSFRIDRELDKMYAETFSGGQMDSLTINDAQIYSLEKENNVLFVFVHMLSHFYKGGVGIKQICDWSRMLWAHRDSLDLKRLDSRLKELGLRSEWKAFGAYAVEYLGMSEQAVPFYDDGEKWKRKAKRIHSFIMKIGNLGHNRYKKGDKVSFLKRKIKSATWRVSDLGHHFVIFPLDTMRFLPAILKNGFHSE